ncbi:cytidine deaminase-like protein [Pholiota conissans]|uniref:Cytosine deaminase n=1 Tax=Pholiota conissans TaxID=109636 RepID=A0A9P5YQN4_9AGAR|nr:cytidine deaminase-like protein [Pholiota conissans]
MSTNVTTATTTADWSTIDAHGLRLAIAQAHISVSEGGIPIGSAILLSIDSYGSEASLTHYTVLGAGHNERLQKGSAILHGEMSALEDAGRLRAEVYRQATLYTTLSPCSMCTGAILLYRIPRVVVAEDTTLKGGVDYLRSKGVEVIVLDNEECKTLMRTFIEQKPEEWNEDIGEV